MIPKAKKFFNLTWAQSNLIKFRFNFETSEIAKVYECLMTKI